MNPSQVQNDFPAPVLEQTAKDLPEHHIALTQRNPSTDIQNGDVAYMSGGGLHLRGSPLLHTNPQPIKHFTRRLCQFLGFGANYDQRTPLFQDLPEEAGIVRTLASGSGLRDLGAMRQSMGANGRARPSTSQSE